MRCLVALLTTLCLCAQAAVYSAVPAGQGFSVVQGLVSEAACVAEIFPANETAGWSTAVFESSAAYDDTLQVRSCGFLEGYLLFEGIYATKVNTLGDFAESRESIERLLTENRAFIDSHTEDQSTYWKHVRLVYAQLDAIADGCAAVSTPERTVTPMDLHMMNAVTDVYDLSEIKQNKQGPRTSGAPSPIHITLRSRGHCSALVRATGSDLIVSHSTWAGFSTMVRVLKTYTMPLSGAATISMAMSATPGVIVSGDDFYVLSPSRLVVTETTMNVFDSDLYSLININSTLSWVRTVIASRLANDGQSWVQIFHMYDSYTYNNQWMVIDMKRFNPQTEELHEGTLTISESAFGGHWLVEDVTNALRPTSKGYWASYNSPYFSEIYMAMRYDYVAGLYGEIFTSDKCPRARIFQRDAPKTVDAKTVGNLVRSNNWQTDNLSGGYPSGALASRFDLKGGPETPGFLEGYFDMSAHGSTDGKVTSAKMLLSDKPRFSAVYGPPVTPDCPPFAYESKWADVPHVGQPDKFNFEWFDFPVQW